MKRTKEQQIEDVCRLLAQCWSLHPKMTLPHFLEHAVFKDIFDMHHIHTSQIEKNLKEFKKTLDKS